MTKCDYCGEKIGLLAVRFTWIEKGKRAIHDSCLKKQEERKKIEAEEKKLKKLYEKIKWMKEKQIKSEEEN
ncbi:MAG: hypothetical protein MUO82_09995 [Candidatus Thermoplasmatota archaeon]|nr:hypothetical protein [Candidatus Thermoplasmatota archaeon]